MDSGSSSWIDFCNCSLRKGQRANEFGVLWHHFSFFVSQAIGIANLERQGDGDRIWLKLAFVCRLNASQHIPSWNCIHWKPLQSGDLHGNFDRIFPKRWHTGVSKLSVLLLEGKDGRLVKRNKHMLFPTWSCDLDLKCRRMEFFPLLRSLLCHESSYIVHNDSSQMVVPNHGSASQLALMLTICDEHWFELYNIVKSQPVNIGGVQLAK